MRTKFVIVILTIILLGLAWLVSSDSDMAQNFRLNSVRYWGYVSLTNNPLLSDYDQDLDTARKVADDYAPRIDLDELLSGGPPKDGIPSIDEPQFEPIAETIESDQQLIIGVYHNGQAKAYPYNILNWHEMVNDTVGGTPVAVSYCPLCETNSVFVREIDGQTVEFGVSGKLYQSCLVMYDRLTDSNYAQPWGIGVTGPQVNHVLERIPAERTTIAQWRAKYPDSLVLTRETGHRRDYEGYPYGSYYTDEAIIFPVRNQNQRDVHPKEIMQVVFSADGATPHNQFSGQAVGLSQAEVQAAGSIEFDWNGSKAVARWDDELGNIEFVDAGGQTIPSMALFGFVEAAFFK